MAGPRSLNKPCTWATIGFGGVAVSIFTLENSDKEGRRSSGLKILIRIQVEAFVFLFCLSLGRTRHILGLVCEVFSTFCFPCIILPEHTKEDIL